MQKISNLLEQLLSKYSKRFREIPSKGQRSGIVIDALLSLVMFPAAIAVLVWVAFNWNLSAVIDYLPLFIVMSMLAALAKALPYMIFIEGEKGLNIDITADISDIFNHTLFLIAGPFAIVISKVTVHGAMNSYNQRRLSVLADIKQTLLKIRFTITMLVDSGYFILMAIIYLALGGAFPIDPADNGMAIALIVSALVIIVIDITMNLFLIRSVFKLFSEQNQDIYTRQLMLSSLSNIIPIMVGLFSAIVYQSVSTLYFGLYILFFIPIILMLNRFSKAVEHSRQRANELQRLEALSAALLAAPPDNSQLTQILEDKARFLIFAGETSIRLFNGDILLRENMIAEKMMDIESAWTWYQAHATADEIIEFPPKTQLPWGGDINYLLSFTPILDTDTEQPIGGIMLSRASLVLGEVSSSLRGLASQISTALHNAEAYQQAIAYNKQQQELEFASEVQIAFFPSGDINLGAWKMSASLQSALKTSGDFYDIIQLPDDKVALVVADVSDKGTGAALFMAFSRTLLRIYAEQYPDDPSKIFEMANNRMQTDVTSDQFVTVFLGILDKKTDTLTYASAGHNPAFLIRDGDIESLKRTGIPLGMLEDMAWKSEQRDLSDKSACLVIYTDGVTEAQNADEDLYEEDRLRSVLSQHKDKSGAELHDAIIADVQHFIDDAPLSDDITLMVIKRQII